MIGYTVVIIFFIYMFVKSFSFQTRLFKKSVVEGLTSNTKKENKLKDFDKEKLKNDIDTYQKMIQEQKDSLKLFDAEYKESYKKIIENMHELTEYRLVRATIAAEDLIRDKNETAEGIEKMTQLNKLKEFLTTLDSTYAALNELAKIS